MSSALFPNLDIALKAAAIRQADWINRFASSVDASRILRKFSIKNEARLGRLCRYFVAAAVNSAISSEQRTSFHPDKPRKSNEAFAQQCADNAPPQVSAGGDFQNNSQVAVPAYD
jgi:hypothetical protein